jgi:holin-like protein
MPIAFAILVGCQLIGEVLRQALRLPLPGPVIGMFLLAAWLVLTGHAKAADDATVPSPLNQTATTLITNMGLLFVPAGVGVIGELPLLRQEWPAILAGLVVSTALSLVVTGLVMQFVCRAVETRRRALPPSAGRTLPADHQESW